MTESQTPRVLSIQSHVVFGYVGNKSATFPLQLLGFEVDPLNSVQFSNHTGYKTVTGQILNEHDLGALADGLKTNKLDTYTHLLTGYIGSESFLKRIATHFEHLRTVNPDIIYVCDPVMGDNGHLYVPADLVPVYRDQIVPLASIITPNQFELELLTERSVQSVADAWAAIDVLHARGVRTVVVSSSELGDENELIAFASTKQNGVAQGGGGGERFMINFPKLPATFTGTGDLFAALFLAWMHKTRDNLRESLEKTVSTVQAVIKRTLDRRRHTKEKDSLELKLVQSKVDIESPTIVATAKSVAN